MKKFAYLLAALSLCACTFTGCSDDGDDDKASSAKKGQSCAELQCEGDLVCNAESKICEEKADEGGDADEACKDKSAGDACGDKKVCDDNLKCVDDKSGEGGEPDAACKGKEAGAECGEGKVCDDALKCVEDKSGEGDKEDEIDCSKLSGVEEAVKALAKVDAANCDALNKAFTDLATSFLTDNVASSEDSADVIAQKGAAVVVKCGPDWGYDEAKAKSLSEANAACSSSELDCSKLEKSKAAAEKVIAADLTKCDDLNSAIGELATAAKDEKAIDAPEEAATLVATCAKDWNITEKQYNDVNDALKACAAAAIDCSKLEKSKAAAEKVIAADLTKCDDLNSAIGELATAAKDEKAIDAPEEAATLVATCAKDWNITEKQYNDVNDALEKCAKEAGSGD